MDKITHYQNVILDVFKEYIAYLSGSRSPIKQHIVADEKNKHYLLVSVGWQEVKRFYSVDTQIDIINDKIWIQEDRIEEGIANLLVEKGIPKSEIVLAYFTPLHREYTEFAVN